MLWHREVVRFLRQRNRVIGALGTPAIFWALLGFGVNNSFQVEGTSGDQVGYLTFFFPGTLGMIVLFTAIFATFSVIEDRKEGFLQAVQASPAPRVAIALGKVLGGATLATIQGVLFLLAWPFIGSWPGVGAMLAVIGVMFLLGVATTALGLCFAWRCDSTAGYHAVMNLLLLPMWFLSGALFPIDTAPLVMKLVMYVNPMTYGQSLLASLLGVNETIAWPISFGVLSLSAVALMILATCTVSAPRKDGT